LSRSQGNQISCRPMGQQIAASRGQLPEHTGARFCSVAQAAGFSASRSCTRPKFSTMEPGGSCRHEIRHQQVLSPFYASQPQGHLHAPEGVLLVRPPPTSRGAIPTSSERGGSSRVGTQRQGNAAIGTEHQALRCDQAQQEYKARVSWQARLSCPRWPWITALAA